MSASAPTRTQLLSLYRRYLSTAQAFSSYNFRTYFLRRSRDLFRSNLLPASQAATSSPYSKAGHTTTPASPASLTSTPPPVLSSSSPKSSSSSAPQQSDAERLRAFYDTAVKDLQVLRRAAITNRMYQGERLVVERPQLIIGGGGAGAEASVGGGGQPTTGSPTAGSAAPKSG